MYIIIKFLTTLKRGENFDSIRVNSRVCTGNSETTGKWR